MPIVCHIDELSDPGSKGVAVDGQPLVVVKHSGQIHVYRNWCPHLGINLEYMPDQFLNLDNRYIQCANHGALFEIDTGHCILGPCEGQNLIDVPFHLDDGHIHVEPLI